MRRLLTPAWLAVHALAAVLVLGMLWLGHWQYERATAGNALSWGYTLQWPLFAAFTAGIWWREVGTARGDGQQPAAAPKRSRRPDLR